MALSFEGKTHLYSIEIWSKIREFGCRPVLRSITSSSTLGRITIIEPLDSRGKNVEKMIFNAIARNPNMHCITNLSGQVTLKQICCLCSRMRNLKKLDVSACNNNADAVESSDIGAILRSNRQLEELFLEDFDNGDMAAEGIAQALRFRSSLKNLQLDNINLTVIGVMAIGRILRQCLSLTLLKIFDQRLNIDVVAAAALTEGIKRSPSLKELLISARSIPRAAGCLVLDSISGNRTLTKVTLPRIELGHDGSLSVARLIEGDNAIESLTLNDRSSFADASSRTTLHLAPIVRALPFNRTLKSMDLCHMSLRMDGIQGSFSTSTCNSSLEKLLLWACRFEGAEDPALFFHVFFKLVAALKFLLVRCCKFEDGVFVHLCDALKLLSSFEVLDLYGTKIGDRGASALASFLVESQTLQRLYLQDSNIKEEGIRALLDSVRVNYSLTWLGGLALTDSQKYELQFYLDRNKGPARAVEATIPMALWPHALSQAACYRVEAEESLDEGDTDSESEDEAEDSQQGPDMLYFLVRERCDEIFRNVPPQNGRRRSKRKRNGYRGRRTKRRGG